MSNIVFTVADTSCESVDKSFFPPRISMSSTSVTTIATVLGFDEMPGFTSLPPKKYHTVSWNGHSEHQLFKGAQQIAGARFDYSGASTIDAKGHYTSFYSKMYSAMCNALTRDYVTNALPGVFGGSEPFFFKGWLGPTGFEKCTPPGLPYTVFNDQAARQGPMATRDSSDLWGTKSVEADSAAKVSNFKYIDSTHGSCLESSPSPPTLGIVSYFNPLVGSFVSPDNTNEGTVWFFGFVAWDHDYSATLSNEYTDAEAAANAQVFSGNGTTAENLPRTTGFTNRSTSVGFSLSISNLIIGTSYLASVELWDSKSGTTSVVQYPFTATASTKTINDTVPTPAPLKTLTVRNPRVAFA